MDKTQHTYDQFAATFDGINSRMPEGLQRAAERFLSYLGASPRIVEIGCGPGRDMAWFESQGATVTGVDFSAGMLEIARTRVQGRLIQMDMRKLDLANSDFDGLWCNAALLHLPKSDVPKTLKGFKRVLASGGLAFFSVQVGEGEVVEGHPAYPGAEQFFARYQPEEFVSLLEAGGFSVLEKELEDMGSRVWLRVFAE